MATGSMSPGTGAPAGYGYHGNQGIFPQSSHSPIPSPVTVLNIPPIKAPRESPPSTAGMSPTPYHNFESHPPSQFSANGVAPLNDYDAYGYDIAGRCAQFQGYMDRPISIEPLPKPMTGSSCVYASGDSPSPPTNSNSRSSPPHRSPCQQQNVTPPGAHMKLCKTDPAFTPERAHVSGVSDMGILRPWAHNHNQTADNKRPYARNDVTNQTKQGYSPEQMVPSDIISGSPTTDTGSSIYGNVTSSGRPVSYGSSPTDYSNPVYSIPCGNVGYPNYCLQGVGRQLSTGTGYTCWFPVFVIILLSAKCSIWQCACTCI